MSHRPRAGWLVLLLSWLVPGGQVFAWSELGHRLVGDLAATRLQPQAQAEVRRLLNGEPEPTLGGVAGWADALRYSDPPRFRATSAWHYINARGGGCGFDVGRDCPNGNCVVTAIQRQREILADASRPLAERRDALKFLVHLVGDLHQPLHAGSRPDSGGNRFQVSLTTTLVAETHERGSVRGGTTGTNLHTVWDYYVLASAGLERERYAVRLRRSMPRAPATPSRTAALDWARESCALVDAERLYPAGHVLDHRYLDARRPLAERRIVLAAARLAAMLNAALAPR